MQQSGMKYIRWDPVLVPYCQWGGGSYYPPAFLHICLHGARGGKQKLRNGFSAQSDSQHSVVAETQKELLQSGWKWLLPWDLADQIAVGSFAISLTFKSLIRQVTSLFMPNKQRSAHAQEEGSRSHLRATTWGAPKSKDPPFPAMESAQSLWESKAWSTSHYFNGFIRGQGSKIQQNANDSEHPEQHVQCWQGRPPELSHKANSLGVSKGEKAF